MLNEDEIEKYIQNTCINCFRNPGVECDIQECAESQGKFCE